jgi:hypothetical protein
MQRYSADVICWRSGSADKHKPLCMPTSNQAYTTHLSFLNTSPSPSSSLSSIVSSYYVLHDIHHNLIFPYWSLSLPLGFCTFSFVLKMFFEIPSLSIPNNILLTIVLFQLFIFKSYIFFSYSLSSEGRAVNHWPLTADPWVQLQASPQGIHAGQSDTQRGFSPSNSVFPCQYHSTNTPHVALTRRADRRRLGDFQKAKLFQKLDIGQQCSLIPQVDTWVHGPL